MILLVSKNTMMIMVFIKKSESLILMITQIKNIEEIKLVT